MIKSSENIYHALLMQQAVIAQVITRRLPLRWPGFEPGSSLVALVVDKAALKQLFSEYFGFIRQAFYRHHHTQHRPSSGACTIDHLVASVIVDSVPLQSNN
jgi:hypothetical protein